MLTALILGSLLQSGSLARDSYGVPIIRAKSKVEAFELNGYAVAQDRLWQMENSRRLARGKMAEVFGPKFVASDSETRKIAYTDEELDEQFRRLPAELQRTFESYAAGVNRYIAEATSAKNLPGQYAANGFRPEPWTPLDSAAVAIQLYQQFGRGGSGELRNLALLAYLKTNSKLKDRALDVVDDFLWQNDSRALTTVSKRDDPVKSPPSFPNPTRAETVAQLSALPKLSLFELLPAVSVAERTEHRTLSASRAVPFQSGSYCIVVSPQRSATGKPMLLSGPQMGFTQPSIGHEISIHAPGLDVAGLDIPGVPGVAIGSTPNLAWGLTTGVADTEDIYVLPLSGNDITESRQTIAVKGGPVKEVVRLTSKWGPIVFTTPDRKFGFARRRSYQGIELQSIEATFALTGAKTPMDVDASLRRATMNFNAFFALKTGDIGWRYTGLMPIRAKGTDPRFPLPVGPKTDWNGLISFEQMPHVWNPSAGILFNWNNKPVDWWSNLDSPVWGEVFRNGLLDEQLKKPKLTVADLERAPWQIARKHEAWSAFAPYLKEGELAGFDGWMLQGSQQAEIFSLFLEELRSEVFLGTTGNFASPSNFRTVTQPSVILAALRSKTKVNYLDRRLASMVVRAALAKAVSKANPSLGYQVSAIPVAGASPIPYRDRGTYIQVIELGEMVRGRNVLPPGVASEGVHSQDQVNLSRAWLYKPMQIQPPNE